MELILKKFSVKKKEISFIVKEIKKRKLSNITPNQKIKFVLRRSSDKEDMEVLKDRISNIKNNICKYR